MTCDEHKERISIWFDGHLDEKAYERTFDHLRECVTCRTFMARLPHQAMLLRSLRPSERQSGTIIAEPYHSRLPAHSPDRRFNAPLAAAAAILLTLLTIAIQSSLLDRDPSQYDEPDHTAQMQQGGTPR